MKSIDCALILVAALVSLAVPQSALGQDVLKGKVRKEDGATRIRRPSMPVLTATESVDDGTVKKSDLLPKHTPHLGGISAQDFALSFTRQAPKNAPTGKQKELTAEDEDQELIIAWEEWHHRVSDAIFQRWRTLGVFPGVAHTILKFSRDGRVDVTVESIELPPNIYEIMSPQYRRYGLDEIKHLFAANVQSSVNQLNGSSIVRFPEGSKRTAVTLTPYFAGDVDEGYHYKHDDYERVKLK